MTYHFASCANDNIIYCAGISIDDIILSLQDSAKKVFQQFSDSQMKGNSDKFYYFWAKMTKLDQK